MSLTSSNFEIYEFSNGQVKPAKSYGTRWIKHEERSTTGFVGNFGVYIQHIKNVIFDISKRCEETMLEGKSKHMVEAEVLDHMKVSY